jgi:hypothetical protein
MKKRRTKTPNASKFNKAMVSARGETIDELKQEIAKLKDTLRVRDADLERLENWTEYTDAKPTLCNKTATKSLKQRLKDKSDKAAKLRKAEEAALKEEHDKLPYPFRAAEHRGSFKKAKKGTKGKKGKKGTKGKKKKGGDYTRKRSRRTRRTRRR